MNFNFVDSVIELANEFNTLIILIASRRKIDSRQFNKGYVNNWSTFEFVKRIKIKGF